MNECLQVGRIDTEFRRNELQYFHSRQIPTVPSGHRQQFALAFGEGDVEASFTSHGTLDQELQAEGSFTGAGLALDEMRAKLRVASAQYIVEPPYARAYRRRIRFLHRAPARCCVASCNGRPFRLFRQIPPVPEPLNQSLRAGVLRWRRISKTHGFPFLGAGASGKDPVPFPQGRRQASYARRPSISRIFKASSSRANGLEIMSMSFPRKSRRLVAVAA